MIVENLAVVIWLWAAWQSYILRFLLAENAKLSVQVG